jgi:cytidyltransferase-like protein
MEPNGPSIEEFNKIVEEKRNESIKFFEDRGTRAMPNGVRNLRLNPASPRATNIRNLRGNKSIIEVPHFISDEEVAHLTSEFLQAKDYWLRMLYKSSKASQVVHDGGHVLRNYNIVLSRMIWDRMLSTPGLYEKLIDDTPEGRYIPVGINPLIRVHDQKDAAYIMPHKDTDFGHTFSAIYSTRRAVLIYLTTNTTGALSFINRPNVPEGENAAPYLDTCYAGPDVFKVLPEAGKLVTLDTGLVHCVTRIEGERRIVIATELVYRRLPEAAVAGLGGGGGRSRKRKTRRRSMRGGKKGSLGVLVGRFQPLHNGHISTILSGLVSNDHFLVVIGNDPPGPKNPYSFEFRKDCIIGAVLEAAPHLLPKLLIANAPPAANGNNWSKWYNDFDSIIKTYADTYSADGKTNLYACGKDEKTAAYLNNIVKRGGESVVKVPIEAALCEAEILSSTQIREKVEAFLSTRSNNYEALLGDLRRYMPNYVALKVVASLN